MKMSRKALAMFVLFSTAVSVHATTVTVHMFNFDFSTDGSHQMIVDPTIRVGDTIHWVNDQGLHCSISCAGQTESWASPLLTMQGQSFDHTFTKPGVFGYFCCQHGFDKGDGTGGGMAGTITVLPAETPPTLVELIRGSFVSGGLPQLGLSDDQRMVVRAATPPPPAIKPIPGPSFDPLQIILTATSPVQSPTSFKFRIEAQAQVANILGSIDLFDYQAGDFVTVDARQQALSDTVVEITASNPGRFVKAGTKEIKSRVRWRANGHVPFPGWQIAIDQIVWLIQ